MIDPFVLFLCVAAAWLVLRVVARGWSGRKLASGELSVQGWAIVNAASWALMPLVAIPFITYPDGRIVLVLIAVAMFIFQFAILIFFQRFIERG